MHHLQKIANIQIEELDGIRLKPEVEHERKVAVFDLLEENYFAPVGDEIGPYDVKLSIEDGKRLVLDVAKEGETDYFTQIKVPLMPVRKIVKDYFLVCDSYFKAIKTASPPRSKPLIWGGVVYITKDQPFCAIGWKKRFMWTTIQPVAFLPLSVFSTFASEDKG